MYVNIGPFEWQSNSEVETRVDRKASASEEVLIIVKNKWLIVIIILLS
jgi:hypothetical protein